MKWSDLTKQLAEADTLRSSLQPYAKPEEIPWGDIRMNEGDQVFEINADDPMVKSVSEAVIANKIPGQYLKPLAQAFLAAQVEQQKADAKFIEEQRAKLGDSPEKIKQRVDAAASFVASVLEPDPKSANYAKALERAQSFTQYLVLADHVEIIEAIAKKIAGPNPAGGGTPDPDAGLTPGQIFFRGMQKAS